MNIEEITFCEAYERQLRTYELLTLLKDNLTLLGQEAYNKVSQWLVDNMDRYLELKLKNGL
ncbi:MAG TPA: hypothetical protein VD794_07020 [Flavisolibacter sp.]|nr:hypothetical protein [Flavisolibacter sp.]